MAGASRSDILCLHAELFQALKHLWSYCGMTELISLAKHSSNDRQHGESAGRKEDQSQCQSQTESTRTQAGKNERVTVHDHLLGLGKFKTFTILAAIRK